MSVALLEPARAAEPEPSTARRAVALGAVVAPGIVVHGSGQWVLGRSRTALRLLAWEGLGLGLFAAGGVPIVLTGASRKIVGPSAAVAIMGVGLFATSLLVDGYATAGWGRRQAVFPQPAAAWVTEFGYRYLYGPDFRYRHLLVQGLTGKLGCWSWAGSLWTGLDDRVARARISSAWRLWRAEGSSLPVRDASQLELQLGGARWLFTPYGFTKWTGEISLYSRYDLRRMDPAFSGSFVEGGVGWGREWVRFEPPGSASSTDANDLLLAEFAFGAYFGDRRGGGGEARIYYDHRHDDWTAGLSMGGIGSGVIGHFGIDVRYYLDSAWGVLAEVQAGSAYLLGLSLLFRSGVSP
jgi:hypothetical protein